MTAVLDIEKFHKRHVCVRITNENNLKKFLKCCEANNLHNDFSTSIDDISHWVYYLRNFDNDICINTVDFMKTPSKHIVGSSDYTTLSFEDIEINKGD